MNKAVSVESTRLIRRREREGRLALDLQPEREVRLGTPEDFPCIMDLCMQLHAENAQHPISMEKVQRMVARCLVRDYGVMPVIGDPGDIRAMMLLLIDQVYYSDERQILELWNFVRSDSRRSSYGRQLLSFAMQLADSTGMHLTCGIITDHSLEAKTRMYERILGKSGAVFIYRPEGAMQIGQR